MRLAHYSTLEEIGKTGPLVIAIGVFDGLHLGHVDLIRALCKKAKENQARAAIWTFDSKLPKPEFSRLMDENSYLKGLESLGVQEVHRMEFIDDVANLSAVEFLEKILIDKLGVKAIVLGEDARLGKDRGCSALEFKAIAQTFNIEVELVALRKIEGEIASSSKIRDLIRAGQFEAAERFLGRSFALSGLVEKDQQLARTMGFPTANVNCDGATLPPKAVYRCVVKIDDSSEFQKALAYLGSRPTVDANQTKQVLEVHIADWSGDLYGHSLLVKDFQKLREEMTFTNLDELKAQIKIDMEML